LQTHNLIGLINEYTKNRNLPIGKIDIMRKFSFFEIPSEFESEVLRGLGNANWNGNRVNVEVSQAPSKQRSSRVDNQTRKRKKNNSFTDSNKRKKQNSSKSFDSKSKSKTSKKEDSRNYSTGSGNDVERSSFKGRFNAAAKRKRRS
jgi:ATP-dependent RNA helicase DeaD